MKPSNNQEDESGDLKGCGYFTPDDLDIGIHAKDYVDKNWDEAEKIKVIKYLRDCYSTDYSYFEWLPCYICNDSDALSSQDMYDGAWIFPEALIHYVEQHNVVPLDAFLERIRANNYQVPALPDGFKAPQLSAMEELGASDELD